jgi:CrcB protein
MTTFFYTAAGLALGAFLGAGLRYFLGLFFINSSYPLGTLISNTLGCFIVGILWAYMQRMALSDYLRIMLVVGFCGSLTTFSSVIVDIFSLMNQHRYLLAFCYFIAVNALGFGALYLGNRLIMSF